MDNPNTEKIVIAWLQSLDEIDGEWPVSGDKPTTPPEKYILVDRTGGPRGAMVLDEAQILIEVYHETSRTTASDMANYIADQIPQLPVYAESITGALVNSVVNLDALIEQYSRYQVYCYVYNRR